MPEPTKQQIAENRHRQLFCASCFYCKTDCKNTEHCIECDANFKSTGIKTGFEPRRQNSKQEGVPEISRKPKIFKRSTPVWMG